MALAAAREIVAAEGAAGLSTRKVAARMGYAAGTLYLVFRNLDDLVLQLNAATLEALDAHLAEALARLPAGAGPRQRLLTLAHAYYLFAQQHFHLWSLVFEHHLPEGETMPESLAARVRDLLGRVEAELAHLGAGAALAARVLWSGVHGIAVLALTDNLAATGPVDAPALVDSLVNRYLDGFAAAGRNQS